MTSTRSTESWRSILATGYVSASFLHSQHQFNHVCNSSWLCFKINTKLLLCLFLRFFSLVHKCWSGRWRPRTLKSTRSPTYHRQTQNVHLRILQNLFISIIISFFRHYVSYLFSICLHIYLPPQDSKSLLNKTKTITEEDQDMETPIQQDIPWNFPHLAPDAFLTLRAWPYWRTTFSVGLMKMI